MVKKVTVVAKPAAKAAVATKRASAKLVASQEHVAPEVAKARAEGTPAPAKPLDADTIVAHERIASGPAGIVATTQASKAGTKGAQLALLDSAMSAELRKLVKVGGSLRAVREYIATHKPEAKLAHGVTARTSPNAARASEQSRTAVADRKAPAKAPENAKAPAAKPAAKPAPKAKGAPTPNTSGKRLSGQAYNGKVEPGMSITILTDGNPYKPGTKAHATFALFAKAGTVAKFREMVAKAPDSYDAGYVRYAARDGFIALA